MVIQTQELENEELNRMTDQEMVHHLHEVLHKLVLRMHIKKQSNNMIARQLRIDKLLVDDIVQYYTQLAEGIKSAVYERCRADVAQTTEEINNGNV